MDARQIFSESPQVKVRSARPDWIELDLPSTAEARNKVMSFVRGELADLTDDLGEQLCLAVDELLRNAIEHGCDGRSPCSVHFELIRTPNLLAFRVRDDGPGFSMGKVKHAAINNPPEEPLRHAQYRTEKGMRPGGFGIMLVREIADDLIYNEAGNDVLLMKYFR